MLNTTPAPGLDSGGTRVVWRPALLLAGVLLFIAPFLYANPFAGFHRRAWPWDIWRESQSFDERTEIAGIALVAVLAIASGLGAFRARFLALVAALSGFIAIRLHGESSTFSLLSVEKLGLTWFASGLVLGVGLLLLARRDGRTRALGIGMTAIGAVSILTFLFAWFPRDPVAEGRSMAEFYVRRVQRFWVALFQGGESDPTSRATLASLIWGQVFPTICLVCSVLLAFLAAACGAAEWPKATRRLAIAAFVAYLCTWLVPLASALILGAGDPGHQGVSGVFGTLGNALLDAGLALWLVLLTSITTLLAEGAARRPISLRATPPGPMIAAPTRAPFAVAFGLGVVSLVAHFHPEYGVAIHAWPSDVARSFTWSPAGAALLFHVFLLAVTFAAFIRGISTRTLVWAFTACFAVALVALEGPIRDELSARRFFLRTPAYVPFLLAGIAVGAAATVGASDTRRIRRSIALVCGLALVAILAYPVSIEPDAFSQPIGPSRAYTSVLTVGLDSATTLEDFLFGFEPRFGCPLTTVLLGLLGLASLTGAIGTPGPLRRHLTWGLFGLATAWPVAQMLIDPIRAMGPEFSVPLRLSILNATPEYAYRAAGAVPFFYLPTAWAGAGLTAAAFARRRGTSAAEVT